MENKKIRFTFNIIFYTIKSAYKGTSLKLLAGSAWSPQLKDSPVKTRARGVAAPIFLSGQPGAPVHGAAPLARKEDSGPEKNFGRVLDSKKFENESKF
jgi:hypothetical protein